MSPQVGWSSREQVWIGFQSWPPEVSTSGWSLYSKIPCPEREVPVESGPMLRGWGSFLYGEVQCIMGSVHIIAPLWTDRQTDRQTDAWEHYLPEASLAGSKNVTDWTVRWNKALVLGLIYCITGSFVFYYSTPTKLQEGNVFIPVCMVMGVWCHFLSGRVFFPGVC